MSIWSPYPFVRLVAALTAGIVLSHSFSFTIATEILIGTGGFALIGLVISFALKSKASGTITLLLFFLIGLSRWQLHDQKSSLPAIEQAINTTKAYSAEILSPPSEKEKYLIYNIKTIQLIGDSVKQNLAFEIKLYLKRNKSLIKPKVGDILAIKGKPFRIPEPKNPHEFDYASYMGGQNIFYQHFIQPEGFQILRSNTGSIVIRAIYDIREKFETIIKNQISDSESRSIALALLIGQKDELSQDIKNSYAAAGAMHVLAVSGLHVGIIYLIIMGFFRPITKRPEENVFASFICIVCLWLYALITGFSPSILRAVTMFSVMIFGRCLGRRSNVYNSIALSAFILLFYNPNFLFTVGFQLSYLAVLGIVSIYQPLYNKLHFDSKALDWIWSITCISISAQIATFPISIYYFHQFPTYFLISNLIVIPAAFIVMLLGIGTILLNSIGYADLLGCGLEYLILSLNWVVEWIYRMPKSTIAWLYLTPGQTWLIYLAIILLMIFHARHNFKYLIRAFAVLFAAVFIGLWNLLEHSAQDRYIIYNVRGIHALDVISGNQAKLTTMKSIKDLELIKYQIDPNRISTYLPEINDYEVMDKRRFNIGEFGFLRVINNKKVFYLYAPIKPQNILLRIETDYLIISHNASNSINELQDFFIFQELIVDSSNDYRTVNALKKHATKQNVKISIVSEGAVEL